MWVSNYLSLNTTIWANSRQGETVSKSKGTKITGGENNPLYSTCTYMYVLCYPFKQELRNLLGNLKLKFDFSCWHFQHTHHTVRYLGMKFLGVLLQKSVTFLHCLSQECEKPSISVYSKAEMEEILQLFKENVLKVQNNYR